MSDDMERRYLDAMRRVYALASVDLAGQRAAWAEANDLALHLGYDATTRLDSQLLAERRQEADDEHRRRYGPPDCLCPVSEHPGQPRTHRPGCPYYVEEWKP